MDEVLDHPRFTSIEHFELCCLEEPVGFYEQCGFMEDLGDLRLMRR